MLGCACVVKNLGRFAKVYGRFFNSSIGFKSIVLLAHTGMVLPDPGLLGALKCGLPGGAGFKLPNKIGFIKFGVLGSGSGAWSASSPTPTSAPPAPSASLWIPVVGLVVPSVGLLPAGFHCHDGGHPGEE